MPEFFLIGIPVLQEQVGPILSRGIIVWEGSPSCYPEHFMYASLASSCSKGEKIALITLFGPPDSIRETLRRVKINIDVFEGAGRWIIEERHSSEEAIVAAMKMIEEGWTVGLDLAGSPLSLSLEDIRSLSMKAFENKSIIQITISPSIVERSLLLFLERMAEIVFSLEMDIREGMLFRYIFLKRSRHLPKRDMLATYSMTPSGLVVEATRRV